MRRTLLLIVTGSVFGAGCRTSDDKCCGTYGRADAPPRFTRSPDCCDAVPASARRPVIGQPTGGGWAGDPSHGFPTVPVYPSGSPTVVSPGGPGPANELPYPNIPPPRLPEGPEAVPAPAVPFGSTLAPPAARTTGEPKTGK